MFVSVIDEKYSTFCSAGLNTAETERRNWTHSATISSAVWRAAQL